MVLLDLDKLNALGKILDKNFVPIELTSSNIGVFLNVVNSKIGSIIKYDS